ncbi:MAG: ABC transporter permease [Bacillus sp. (in: firmicutes)]
MNKFWVVFVHTYLTKVKSKAFITSTVIMLAIVLLITNLPNIIAFFDKDEDIRIGILDDSNQYYEALTKQLEAAQSEIMLEPLSSDAEGERLVAEEQLKGYLLIQNDTEGMPGGVYKSDSIAEETVSTELMQALSSIKSQLMANSLNITDEQIASLYAPVSFEKVALEETAKTAEELNAARGLVYILLFVIYFCVMNYASMIATEVAGEKTSRVMEILVSSISPVQQMFAKIMGIALLSLTQLFFFFVVGYTSIKMNSDQLQGDIFSILGFESTPVSTVLYACLFTLLGYFIYATLAAFLGSLVSRVEEVQTMITPMIMLVVVALFIAVFGLSNPEAGFVKVASFIPFFSPMVMFLRIGMLEIPFWEIALSLGILIATIVVLGVFGARIYRGGVLMYSSGSAMKSMKQAINLTKKG